MSTDEPSKVKHTVIFNAQTVIFTFKNPTTQCINVSKLHERRFIHDFKLPQTQPPKLDMYPFLLIIITSNEGTLNFLNLLSASFRDRISHWNSLHTQFYECDSTCKKQMILLALQCFITHDVMDVKKTHDVMFYLSVIIIFYLLVNYLR
jgi:hypothetical protein